MDDAQTTGAPLPTGVSPLRDRDRRRVMNVTVGDLLEWTEQLDWTDDAGDPPTVDNSILLFRLVDQRFTRDVDAVWEGTWGDGIAPVDSEQPGVVRITVPDEVSASLRRGSYMYSLRVSGLNGERPSTVFDGYFLTEYAPTSPHRNISYRSDSDQDIDT